MPEPNLNVRNMNRILILAGWLLGLAFVNAAETGSWVATWATAQQLTEKGNLPPEPGFANGTLRQKLRVSIGGEQLRVRFSNEFGNAPLTLEAAQVALSAGEGAIRPGTGRALTFHGGASVTIQPGATVISDPVVLSLAPLADVAITIMTKGAPSDVTGHPGSRTTSYFAHDGSAPNVSDLSGGKRADHWYFISSIDVMTAQPAAAIAILGDSITDGRGSTTNGQTSYRNACEPIPPRKRSRY
jgi:hypothetical protein